MVEGAVIRTLHRIPNFCRCANWCSTSAVVSTYQKYTERSSQTRIHRGEVELDLPSEVLPSKSFLSGLKYDYEKNKLAKLLSEMEVLYEMSDKLPMKLTEENWKFYFNLSNLLERERFLTNLYHNHQNQKKVLQQLKESAEEREKLISDQMVRYSKGEVVYSPLFNNLLSITGRHFRKLIDKMYGSRLYCQERLDERMPFFVIDCRFLHELTDNLQHILTKQVQSLYEKNWFSRVPFPIAVVNVLADDRLAQYIKKNWLFLTGPPCAQNDEEHDFSSVFSVLDGEEPSIGAFQPHPYSPSVSSRSILDQLHGLNKGNVAFIIP
ncbi:hypothetical protein AB6A40_002546 [Gnathostoma spinigerum]|uniref:Uncharacterized protein n=1 Tax=Gnathostoma spinigerum TaxID=75299 RepID=A0ABD6E948_9BILA